MLESWRRRWQLAPGATDKGPMTPIAQQRHAAHAQSETLSKPGSEVCVPRKALRPLVWPAWPCSLRWALGLASLRAAAKLQQRSASGCTTGGGCWARTTKVPRVRSSRSVALNERLRFAQQSPAILRLHLLACFSRLRWDPWPG